MLKVVIVSAGGTITSRHDRQADALASLACGEELLASPGALAPDVPASGEKFCNIGSLGMDLDTSFRLATCLDTILIDSEAAGVVATHGADTMEEAVFLSDLMVASDKPIVFTGAQRHATETDADGPHNLADSMRVAVGARAWDDHRV